MPNTQGYRFRVDKETMRAPAGPPASPGEGDTRGFGTNHPTCKRCGAPARPAVLFFGDSMFVPDDHQRQGFVMWMEAVRDLASVRNLSLVIMYVLLISFCPLVYNVLFFSVLALSPAFSPFSLFPICGGCSILYSCSYLSPLSFFSPVCALCFPLFLICSFFSLKTWSPWHRFTWGQTLFCHSECLVMGNMW